MVCGRVAFSETMRVFACTDKQAKEKMRLLICRRGFYRRVAFAQFIIQTVLYQVRLNSSARVNL